MTVPHVSSEWRKASYSNTDGSCVEVAWGAGSTHVRDTKDRAAGFNSVSREAWAAFLSDVREQQV